MTDIDRLEAAMVRAAWRLGYTGRHAGVNRQPDGTDFTVAAWLRRHHPNLPELAAWKEVERSIPY